jgi:UDP-N-acetylmuramate--alanine ligase
MDVGNLKKVHFIGITSPFSSFCANYLIQKGIKVTASEISQNSEEAKEWIEREVLYEGGHSGKYITDDIDLVVYPTGPIPGNPECVVTEEKGIATISIAELTGLIGRNFKVIAIAGTHGKTTTSALVVWTLYKAFGELPNFIIGDKILEIGKSWNFNIENEYLVIEACEYKEQFLDRAPSPFITVVTNIELDHTDYFKSQSQYNEAFVKFISNTRERLIIDSEGINIQEILKEIEKERIKVFDVNDVKEKYENVTAGLKGEYNKQNILRACAVAEVLGKEVDIEDFPGVASRFEFKGTTPSDMPVYLDYAHNPRKISACLKSTRENFSSKKIIFVWQPHSFERTYSFKEQFAESISDADIVYIPNIFAPTREERRYRELISEEQFVDFLKEKNPQKDIRLLQDSSEFEKTSSLLLSNEFNEDYIAVLASAGDLYKILPKLNLNK